MRKEKKNCHVIEKKTNVRFCGMMVVVLDSKIYRCYSRGGTVALLFIYSVIMLSLLLFAHRVDAAAVNVARLPSSHSALWLTAKHQQPRIRPRIYNYYTTHVAIRFSSLRPVKYIQPKF